MQDTNHLVALQSGLSSERARLALATKPQEIALRTVWVSQLEREVADERKFLGIEEQSEVELTDDELMAELMA